MEIPSHAYCRNCEKIQPVGAEGLHPAVTPQDEGSWQAGDLVCLECAWIVATLYEPVGKAAA